MDWVLILTIIGTGVAVTATIVGVVIGVSSMFKADMIKMHTDMKTFEGEIRGWKDEIYKEMKDFHGRLCSLEGRTKTDP